MKFHDHPCAGNERVTIGRITIYIYAYVGLIVDDLCFVRQQLLLADLLVFEVACRTLVGLGLRPKRLTWALRTWPESRCQSACRAPICGDSQTGCKHGHDIIFKGRMVLKKISNCKRLIFCVSWMGRQKLGEVTRTNPFLFLHFAAWKLGESPKLSHQHWMLQELSWWPFSSHVLFVKPL